MHGYGTRIVKYSSKRNLDNKEDGIKYVGEWSTDSDELNGRCISIYPSGTITLGYYKNGYYAPGKYITVFSSGEFAVGERYEDADGNLNCRGL